MLNTYGCNVLTGVIAQISQAVGASHLAAKVTAAAGDVDSARQSFELWELSRQVSSSPVLVAAFDQGVDGLLERLHASSDPAAKSFLARWDAFIDRWGFIGPSVWEFRSPTYRTNPEIPLRMLDRARRAPDSSSPASRSATLIAQREAAIAEIAGRLRRQCRDAGPIHGGSPLRRELPGRARAQQDALHAPESRKRARPCASWGSVW